MNSLDEHLILLRDLTQRVVEEGNTLGFRKELGLLLSEGYPSQFQLHYAYLVLLAHLLGFPPLPIEPHQMPNGTTCLDLAGLRPGGQVPELQHIAELGSLWMILGVLLKNETLLYAGLKVAVWQMHTLDHNGMPHFSLWACAASFNAHQLTAYNNLLFTLAYRLTSDRGFFRSIEEPIVDKLLTLIPEKISSPIQLSQRPLMEEVTVGLLKFTTPQWSLACSLSGWNSGLVSYHKKNVAILNCGPQIAPLDDLRSFGIDRSCSLKTRRFHDVIWEKTSFHFRLKGWTKLFTLPIWMEADCFFQAQKLTLSCLFQEASPRDNLRLTFYCRCEKMVIGGKQSLQAGTLDRYQGKSLPLELCTGDEVIFIEPLADLEMEIIPLAGGDYFWGADFLVAFPVVKELLQYTIK